jgi:hypothetical protein
MNREDSMIQTREVEKSQGSGPGVSDIPRADRHRVIQPRDGWVRE